MHQISDGRRSSGQPPFVSLRFPQTHHDSRRGDRVTQLIPHQVHDSPSATIQLARAIIASHPPQPANAVTRSPIVLNLLMDSDAAHNSYASSPRILCCQCIAPGIVRYRCLVGNAPIVGDYLSTTWSLAQLIQYAPELTTQTPHLAALTSVTLPLYDRHFVTRPMEPGQPDTGRLSKLADDQQICTKQPFGRTISRLCESRTATRP